MATPSLYGDVLEDPNHLEDPALVEYVVSRMIEELRGVKKSLKIYAGEAYWVIFDHPRLLSTLRRLAKNGVKIQMVVGPALSAGGSKDSPQVLRLAEEGCIEFFSRPTRGEQPHFRILDDCVAIVQPPHRPLQPLHSRAVPEAYTRSDNAVQFEQYLEVFECFTRGRSPLAEPEREFIVLRSSEFRSIEELAEGNYDSLERADIERLLAQVRQSTEVKRQRVIGAAEKWEQSATSP